MIRPVGRGPRFGSSLPAAVVETRRHVPRKRFAVSLCAAATLCAPSMKAPSNSRKAELAFVRMRPPSVDFHQVFAYNDAAGEVLAYAFGPHRVGDVWIVAGHEVRQHQRLHSSLSGDPAH